jgi:hypothetical protein
VDGRPIRESSRSTKREEAKRLLREREGRVATGQTISRPVDEVRYEEVAADLRAYYQAYGSRDLKEAEYRLKRLDTYFSGRRVASIGPADLTAYAARRQAEGIKNATMNRELATLSRMLHLAHENDKLLKVPRIRKLREAAPRQGFFERERFETVRRQLSPDLQVVVTIGYVYGWRVRGKEHPCTSP